MRTNLRTLQVIIAGLVLSMATWGQAMTRVRGHIIGLDGKPVEGAEIQLERTDIRGNYSVKTNEDGDFLHATLPRGTYNIRVVINGETAVEVDGVQTNPGQEFPMDIDLRTLQQDQQAAAEEALSEEERKEYEEAKKAAEEAAARDKELQDSFNLGMQAVQAKNWDVAIENLTKAGEVDPTQHVVFAQLAEAHSERAATRRGAAADVDLNLAAGAYAKAVALQPENPNYHNNYALTLARAKKYDEAQAELEQAAALDPPQAGKYFYNLGATYFNSGQNDPAEAAFRKAIELQPDYAEAYYQLGTVLISKATLDGNKMVAPDGTVEAFQSYLKMAPTGPNSDAAKAMLDALGVSQ